MQPVVTASGKWRRTLGGKLRLGCCDCVCITELFSMTFAGITISDCIWNPPPCFGFAPCCPCCHENSVSDDLNQTFIAPRFPNISADPAALPFCWYVDTGITLSHRCDPNPLGTFPPVTPVHLYAGVFCSPGIFPTGVAFLGAFAPAWQRCEIPIGGLFRRSFTVTEDMFCEPVVLTNERTQNLVCNGQAAYGGTVTLTPI